MKTYIASRASAGNRLLPSTITIADHNIIIKDPLFFGGCESVTPYSKISTVKIKCPMIGFSDIILDITGTDRLVIHGFTANEAKEIKSAILSNLKN